jgi:mercuric ion transport protein
MTDNDRSDSPGPPDGSGPSGLLLGSGVALFAAVCCAGPALIAAGALSVIGGWLGNPWVLGAAVALLVAAVLWTVTRRHGTSDSAAADRGALLHRRMRPMRAHCQRPGQRAGR